MALSPVRLPQKDARESLRFHHAPIQRFWSVRPCDPKMLACFFKSSPAILCHFTLTFSRLPPACACKWHQNLLTPTKLPRVSTGFHGFRFPFAGFLFLRVSRSPSLDWSVIPLQHKNSSLARHLQATAGVADPRCHFLSRDATNGAIQFSSWLIYIYMIIVNSLSIVYSIIAFRYFSLISVPSCCIHTPHSPRDRLYIIQK